MRTLAVLKLPNPLFFFVVDEDFQGFYYWQCFLLNSVSKTKWQMAPTSSSTSREQSESRPPFEKPRRPVAYDFTQCVSPGPRGSTASMTRVKRP